MDDQPSSTGGKVTPSRRKFLRAGTATLAGLLLPGMAQARGFHRHWLHDQAERVVRLFNVHTGEYFTQAYWAHGHYLHAALARIDFLFRDHHNDKMVKMDPRLLDVLYNLNHLTGNKKTIAITSAYRSPETNEALIAQGISASPRSYHMRGMAVDLTIPGTALQHVHEAALALHAGGVGYYPNDHFVHVDVGPVRHWQLG